VLQAHFAETDNAIMCGRYELHTFPVALALAFGLKYPPEIEPATTSRRRNESLSSG